VTLYRDVGVVLRTYKLGEADRIIVFCTQNSGKVRAVAKGVRKTKSKFGSRLEVGSHVVLQLYEGRGDLDIVNQAELVETGVELRSDLTRMGRVASMLEAVDGVIQEGQANPAMYEMLVGGLRAVAKWDTALVTPAFFFRLLEAEGVGLQVEGCAVCGETDELVSIDMDQGGLRCTQHREGMAISPQAVLILQLILGGRVATALALPAGPAIFEVEHLASKMLERHLDRRLRSLHVFDHT
jgi:DNA repair protein RecO (recombination protein O)